MVQMVPIIPRKPPPDPISSTHQREIGSVSTDAHCYWREPPDTWSSSWRTPTTKSSILNPHVFGSSFWSSCCAERRTSNVAPADTDSIPVRNRVLCWRPYRSTTSRCAFWIAPLLSYCVKEGWVLASQQSRLGYKLHSIPAEAFLICPAELPNETILFRGAPPKALEHLGYSRESIAQLVEKHFPDIDVGEREVAITMREPIDDHAKQVGGKAPDGSPRREACLAHRPKGFDSKLRKNDLAFIVGLSITPLGESIIHQLREEVTQSRTLQQSDECNAGTEDSRGLDDEADASAAPKLSYKEEVIVQTLGSSSMYGKKIAAKSGFAYSGSLRDTLASLVRQGVLINNGRGYRNAV